jgi:hypothetical protein
MPFTEYREKDQDKERLRLDLVVEIQTRGQDLLYIGWQTSVEIAGLSSGVKLLGSTLSEDCGGRSSEGFFTASE